MTTTASPDPSATAVGTPALVATTEMLSASSPALATSGATAPADTAPSAASASAATPSVPSASAAPPAQPASGSLQAQIVTMQKDALALQASIQGIKSGQDGGAAGPWPGLQWPNSAAGYVPLVGAAILIISALGWWFKSRRAAAVDEQSNTAATPSFFQPMPPTKAKKRGSEDHLEQFYDPNALAYLPPKTATQPRAPTPQAAQEEEDDSLFGESDSVFGPTDFDSETAAAEVSQVRTSLAQKRAARAMAMEWHAANQKTPLYARSEVTVVIPPRFPAQTSQQPAAPGQANKIVQGHHVLQGDQTAPAAQAAKAARPRWIDVELDAETLRPLVSAAQAKLAEPVRVAGVADATVVALAPHGAPAGQSASATDLMPPTAGSAQDGIAPAVQDAATNAAPANLLVGSTSAVLVDAALGHVAEPPPQMDTHVVVADLAELPESIDPANVAAGLPATSVYIDVRLDRDPAEEAPQTADTVKLELAQELLNLGLLDDAQQLATELAESDNPEFQNSALSLLGQIQDESDSRLGSLTVRDLTRS